MTITLRLTKGSALEYSELDGNFIHLRDVAGQTSGTLDNVVIGGNTPSLATFTTLLTGTGSAAAPSLGIGTSVTGLYYGGAPGRIGFSDGAGGSVAGSTSGGLRIGLNSTLGWSDAVTPFGTADATIKKTTALGGAPSLVFSSSGVDIFCVAGNSDGAQLRGSNPLSWSTGVPGTSASDTYLYRGSAGVVEQRNGTNAQVSRVYNTYTDVNNYERVTVSWAGNVAALQTEAAGTGVLRNMRIGPSTARWILDTTKIAAETDNSIDIGATSANRPRTIYAGTSIISQGGGGGTASGMQVVAANPAIMLGASGQAADTKYWDFFINGAVLTGRITNDANSVGANWLTVTRAATVIGNISFYGGATAGEQLRIIPTSAAVNYVTVVGGATGNPGVVSVDGETNISLVLRGKGNAAVILGNGTGDIQWTKALVALGGGAAPTFGTVGGSGPATAAQNTWMRVLDSTGAACWVPVWK